MNKYIIKRKGWEQYTFYFKCYEIGFINWAGITDAKKYTTIKEAKLDIKKYGLKNVEIITKEEICQ